MMKYVSLTLLLITMPLSAAITTAPRKGPEGNRFLFVVDTSSSMKRLDQGGRQAVYDLIYSGLEDRMQPGDTFGVWTFGDDVKGGVFPVQVWAPERNAETAAQVARFLKEQPSGRGSRLDNAVTNVERLVKSVGEVDVIFVTSAASRFKPDESWALLEQAWKGRVDEARKNNKPLMMAFAGRNGQIMQATVTIGGEQLKLMPPPVRRAPPVAKAPDAEPAPVKVAREPIIMQGTSNPKPIESLPTKFAPPRREAPAPEALTDPQPTPVPVLAPERPIVKDGKTPAKLTVAAREPGNPGPASSQAPVGVSSRMLIIAGVSLMLIAGILGVWMLIYVRSRNRISYISRSMTDKP